MSRVARSRISACVIIWAVSPALAAAREVPENKDRNLVTLQVATGL
jgi:hypothetical protein